MGQSQSYLSSVTNATTKKLDQDFQAAEALAFEHVQQALAKMPGCCEADLEQAAFSYYCEGLRLQGVQFREEYARRKATKFAYWWHEKHSASRTPRPHTRYSKAQALRGRVVSQIRRGTRADIDGLLAQIAASKGVKAIQIAEEIGRTAQHTRRLLKRTFSRLLVVALIGTFGKGSVGVPLIFDTGRDLKEQSPNVRLEVGGDQIRPEVAGLPSPIGEIERIGAAIPDLLRGHWAAQGL